MRPEEILTPTPRGLFCRPGGFFIDPVRPVERALITHGHSDHARAGHSAVLATAETLAVMSARYGEGFAGSSQVVRPGEKVRIGDAVVSYHPAGHVLGSAQILVEAGGLRIVVTGDYKREADPTCASFELVACDVLISEATFGLPVFRHPDSRGEIARLLRSLALFPDRTHLVGAYSLGKAQRVIALLREAGHERPVYIHGALEAICALYQQAGVRLGPLVPVRETKGDLAGEIVVAPPGAMSDAWARRFADPVTAFASGWMRVRARARQNGVELPMVISDHADWDDLTRTVLETGCEELWVTHGQEDALVHWAGTRGLAARPLRLVGYEEEGDAVTPVSAEPEDTST